MSKHMSLKMCISNILFGECDRSLTLTMEDGGEEQYEVLDSFSYKGVLYVIVQDNENSESIIIFKTVRDSNKEEQLVCVPDGDESDRVFAKFKERNSYRFDFK